NFAQRVQIDRNFTPADTHDATLGKDVIDDRLDFGDRLVVAQWEEERAYSEILIILQLVAEFGSSLAEKRIGELGQYARTNAGFHIGINSCAMGHAANRSEGVIQNLVRTFSLQVCDGAHAAVVVLVGKLVQGTWDQGGARVVE